MQAMHQLSGSAARALQLHDRSAPPGSVSSSGSGSSGSRHGTHSGSSKGQLGQVRIPPYNGPPYNGRNTKPRSPREAEAMSNDAALVTYSDAQVCWMPNIVIVFSC